MGKYSEKIYGYPFRINTELGAESLNQICETLDEIPAYKAGSNVTIKNNIISAVDTKYQASDFDIKNLKDSNNLRQTWTLKQDRISDLSEIRAGAKLGATAIQSYSEIINDNSVDDKTTYSSIKIVEMFSNISSFNVILVDELPENGEPNTFYFVKSTDPNDLSRNEYMWIDDKWELIGNTTIDLSDYYTKQETDNLLITKQDVISDLSEIRRGAALGATSIQELPVIVDDSKTGTETTYSSSKITELINSVNVDVDLSDYYTKTETNDLLNGKQDKLIAGENITINGNIISATVGDSADCYCVISYSGLKDLLLTKSLTPGMTYRITDYQCTVANDSNAQAINEGQFDILITALDDSYLNENVKFTHHSGDTYFDNCKLESWEGKYCLDNDTTRFAWADNTPSGKGVIYWLKDEWGNECGYDFKNIQFKRITISGDTVYYYTFGGVVDNTLNGNSNNNIIKPYTDSTILRLNNNIFGENCFSNILGYNSYNNTFGNYYHNITFGNCIKNNVFEIDFISSCCFGNEIEYCIINNYITSNENYLKNINILSGTKGVYNHELHRWDYLNLGIINDNKVFLNNIESIDNTIIPTLVCGFTRDSENNLVYVVKDYITALMI